MTRPFVLAHLSDPHLGPLPRPHPFQLLGKRALGYINWQRKRHAVHRRDVLARLIADLHAQAPDHIAITGDLINIALPNEFTEALAWLRTVGDPKDVSLVPGNHDAYALSMRHHFADAWADYMRGDTNPAGAARFPYVRQRGPLTLIGVSTAVPTAPFMATGVVGRTQLDGLDAVLSQPKEDQCRVLLIHHPLVTAPGRWSARLRDADDLLAILEHRGVDLVLHGHDHRHATVWINGPRGKIPVLGVPSASASMGGHHEPAAYQLITVTPQTDGWHIARRVRGFRNDVVSSEIADIASDDISSFKNSAATRPTPDRTVR